jgi:hypothetical protein
MCGRCFSSQTFKDTYRQKKPELNAAIFKLYSSAMTQRRMAKVLQINRKTVVRKFLFLAELAKKTHRAFLSKIKEQGIAVQFDEMESFEHTRLKPLSIALAVNSQNGHLISLAVAPFACKGKRASLARQKYGHRPDKRPEARLSVLNDLYPFNPSTITTDQHLGYPALIKETLPESIHLQTKRVLQSHSLFVKNRRRNRNDALFALNLTCAKIRHDLSRMGRRVWVTTKKATCLEAHLFLYIAFHNGYWNNPPL